MSECYDFWLLYLMDLSVIDMSNSVKKELSLVPFVFFYKGKNFSYLHLPG